jgi:diguanylate cyclase
MSLKLNRKKISRSLLMIASIFGILGAINLFEPATLAINTLQSKIKTKPVSGDIVVVGIDFASTKSVGRWPWSRDVQGTLLQNIDSYNPKAVYVDIGYTGKTTEYADKALSEAIDKMRAPIRFVALASLTKDRAVKTTYSDKDIIGSSKSVSAFAPYSFGYIKKIPTSIDTDQGKIQSASSSMAGLNKQVDQNYRIDFNFDPNSITNISAKDVLAKTVSGNKIKDKIVILGITNFIEDMHLMPGWGNQPGLIFQVLGAETLKYGLPIDLGWLPFFVLALAIAAFHLTHYGLRHSKAICWLGGVVIMGISTGLTILHISNDPLPAVIMIISVGIYMGRQKRALMRAQRNDETGFADMSGYMVSEVLSSSLLVAAIVTRSSTSRGYILETDSVAIIKEAGRRLSTVVDERHLTHNENHQFVWEMPEITTRQLGEHLEGLRQLFSQPLNIDGRIIDVDIAFGVDRDVSTNIQSRMKNALDSSIDARDAGATFKISTSVAFEAHMIKHFTTEFEAALANGDVITMFEAQNEPISSQIRGAEISLLWNHGVYGEISGATLLSLAKASGNLESMSLYLLNEAGRYAAKFQNIAPGFAISVKTTIAAIDGEKFQKWIASAMDDRPFRPNHIIFDVTDIHANQDKPSTSWSILNLQQHGFRVGIGSFGVTASDIDFIKKYKPDMLFMDAGFSAGLLGSTSNELYTVAALRIARAENIKTVSQNVVDRLLLAKLQQYGCDFVQGKIISNPLNYNAFISKLEVQSYKKTG